MDLTPRVTSFATPNHSWLGSSHGTQNSRPVTLDIMSFTENDHYPNGYLPDGTPIAEVDGLGVLYDAGASDGSEVLAGFILEPVAVRSGGTVIAPLLDHGRILVDNLPFDLVDSTAVTSGQFILLPNTGVASS